MSNHFNKLTPAEAERLALLAEECGELVQAIGKVLRHGYESHDPTNPNHHGNQDDVAHEIGDVCYAMTLMGDAGDYSYSVRDFYFREKEKKVGKYLHHQDPTPSPSADAGDGEALRGAIQALREVQRNLGRLAPVKFKEDPKFCEAQSEVAYYAAENWLYKNGYLRRGKDGLEECEPDHALASRLQVDARDAEHFPAESEPARCCFRLPNGNRCSAERETHSFCCAHAVAVRALASGANP